MNPMMLQGGLAGPLVFGLVVFTALRRRTTPVHHLLLALLSMILVWMVAMLLHSTDSEPLEAIALQLTLVPMCAMSPLFLVMMGHYARLDLFERRWDTSLAILAPFGVFYLIFLTNPWHRMALVETGADALFDDPMSFGGPFYWAFQFWSNLVAACGLGLCGWLFLRASSRGQRIRVLLLSSAVLFPLTAHLCFVFRVLPIGFALTPSALGMTALLVVLGIGRYRLWEFQPLVRRDVIEVSGDAVILVDDAQLVVDMNPAASALLGTPLAALRGEPLPAVLARLAPGEIAESVREALASERAGTAPLRRLVEAPGGRIFELTLGSPLDAEGRCVGHYLSLRDRTAERRLHQSQRLESVGILAAGVAHEVNNPLSYVRANLTHLRRLGARVESRRGGLPQPEGAELGELAEVVDESIHGLDRIAAIVEGLLRLARAPSGEHSIVELERVVSEALRFAQLERSAGVRIEAELTPDLPGVKGSASQLVQVLLNLMLNAKRAVAGRPDPRIRVRASAADGWVELAVADNGPGVAPELRARIFDPFFTTQAQGEGTGLGLSIASDIVREHGGSLELRDGDDAGACFVVRLPAAAGAARAEGDLGGGG